MVKDVEVFNNTLEPIDFSNKVFTKGITEILGKDKGDKVIADLNLNGNIKKFPDEFEKTFLITNTEMRYDKVSRSFLSMGKIGLGAINKSVRQHRSRTSRTSRKPVQTGFRQPSKDDLRVYPEIRTDQTKFSARTTIFRVRTKSKEKREVTHKQL